MPEFKTKLGEATLSVSEYSWFNKGVHLVTSDGKVYRGTCGQLSWNRSTLYITVRFKKNARYKQKKYCPLFLLMAELLWRNRDIVSEPECVEGDPMSCLPDLLVSDVVTRLLTSDQVRMLRWTQRQIRLLKSL
jgi:hypothetical protein